MEVWKTYHSSRELQVHLLLVGHIVSFLRFYHLFACVYAVFFF